MKQRGWEIVVLFSNADMDRLMEEDLQLANSRKRECSILDLCPYLNSCSRPSVAIPIFEPELQSEVEKMDHGRIRSLPLLALTVKFFSEAPLDPLYFDFSAASWFAVDARHTETYS